VFGLRGVPGAPGFQGNPGEPGFTGPAGLPGFPGMSASHMHFSVKWRVQSNSQVRKIGLKTYVFEKPQKPQKSQF